MSQDHKRVKLIKLKKNRFNLLIELICKQVIKFNRIFKGICGVFLVNYNNNIICLFILKLKIGLSHKLRCILSQSHNTDARNKTKIKAKLKFPS